MIEVVLNRLRCTTSRSNEGTELNAEREALRATVI